MFSMQKRKGFGYGTVLVFHYLNVSVAELLAMVEVLALQGIPICHHISLNN
jgi:hypothetical protein